MKTASGTRGADSFFNIPKNLDFFTHPWSQLGHAFFCFVQYREHILRTHMAQGVVVVGNRGVL